MFSTLECVLLVVALLITQCILLTINSTVLEYSVVLRVHVLRTSRTGSDSY